MFNLIRIPGMLKCKSPLFHGGNEKTGSVVLLNRMKFIVGDSVEDIPFISGNAIRGYLRRLVFRDLLNLVGYEIDLSKKGGRKLYHSLFTGGVLETVDEKSSGVIDIELKKQIIELIPPARLFGFSIGNQTIESKLKVAHALPICVELSDYLPGYIKPTNSVYDLLTHVFQTRRDEMREEREDNEQTVQMMIEYEVFAPGTVFYHEFRVEDVDDVDLSCIARMIRLWETKPFIGGKSSIGFGELKISYDFNVGSNEYLDFVKKHSDEICDLLDSLQNR